MEINCERTRDVSFSFIMPAYKAKFLYKAINSILNQTYGDFKLVIVNHASADDIKGTVDLFHDERIRYEVNKTNMGGTDLIANWNHCLTFAKNEYIILATDDDIFESTFLSDAVSLINKYPYTDLIRSGVRKIDEQEQIQDEEFPLKEFMTSREFTLFYAKGGTISCVSNYIFRKEALLAVGGFISFPKAHYSDDATALAMSSKGVACMSNINFNFRVSRINLSNRTDLSIVREQLKATVLYMGWYQEHVRKLDSTPTDYFRRACYGGFKLRYNGMISNLVSKIPIHRMLLAIKTIYSNEYLFTKEKCKLFVSYIIDKL